MDRGIVTITNMDTGEYFFSTDHIQPMPEEWVPVTHYNEPYDIVRQLHQSMGEIEIENPDPNYIPDYIVEEN